jgi:hypothetical protein
MRDKDARSWCRIGEALALDWSNVRLHEQSARIGMSKNGETPGHSIIGHYANAFSGKSSVLFQQFYSTFADRVLWNVEARLAALGKVRQLLSDHFAEADRSVGLPKTLRQPSLRLARCLRMQAVIRCTFGISDAQSRKTSPVQSCR